MGGLYQSPSAQSSPIQGEEAKVSGLRNFLILQPQMAAWGVGLS